MDVASEALTESNRKVTTMSAIKIRVGGKNRNLYDGITDGSFLIISPTGRCFIITDLWGSGWWERYFVQTDRKVAERLLRRGLSRADINRFDWKPLTKFSELKRAVDYAEPEFDKAAGRVLIRAIKEGRADEPDFPTLPEEPWTYMAEPVCKARIFPPCRPDKWHAAELWEDQISGCYRWYVLGQFTSLTGHTVEQAVEALRSAMEPEFEIKPQ
jgi:hypothetical protein